MNNDAKKLKEMAHVCMIFVLLSLLCCYVCVFIKMIFSIVFFFAFFSYLPNDFSRHFLQWTHKKATFIPICFYFNVPLKMENNKDGNNIFSMLYDSFPVLVRYYLFLNVQKAQLKYCLTQFIQKMHSNKAFCVQLLLLHTCDESECFFTLP